MKLAVIMLFFWVSLFPVRDVGVWDQRMLCFCDNGLFEILPSRNNR